MCQNQMIDEMKNIIQSRIETFWMVFMQNTITTYVRHTQYIRSSP